MVRRWMGGGGEMGGGAKAGPGGWQGRTLVFRREAGSRRQGWMHGQRQTTAQVLARSLHRVVGYNWAATPPAVGGLTALE